MADVFISYARDDHERAKPIAHALTQRGWSVWWDQNLRAGGNYPEAIEREVKAARCVIVLWSAKSVHSTWVRNESRVGLRRRVLVPVLIDDVEPPLEFSHVHSASLVKRGTDTPEFEALMEAVQAFAPRDVVPPVVSAVAPPAVQRRAPEDLPRTITTASAALVALAFVVAAAFGIGYLFSDQELANAVAETSGTATQSDTSSSVAPAPERSLAGIGRLIVAELPLCTAFLTSSTQAMTAKECVRGNPPMMLRLKLQHSAPVDYVVRLVASSVNLPYAVLTLDSPALPEFVPLQVRTRRIDAGEEVLIGYFDREMELSIIRVPLLSVNTESLAYAAPTRPGSMGAPLIAVVDGAVLGIHIGGSSASGVLKRAVLLPLVDPQRVSTKRP